MKNGLWVVTTGVLVLILWAIVWFWADWGLRMGMGSRVDSYSLGDVVPGWLIETEWKDPETRPPFFRISFDPEKIHEATFTHSREFNLSRTENIYESTGVHVSYDKSLGKIVYRLWDENSTSFGPVSFFAGPEGFSDVDSEATGKFQEPLLFGTTEQVFVYDEKLHQFFRIDIEVIDLTDESGKVVGFKTGKKNVVKGPLTGEETVDNFEPIQIGTIKKGVGLNISFIGSAKKEYRVGSEGVKYGEWKVIINTNFREWDAGEHILILNKNGRIDLLNKETLEVSGSAGYLPEPQDFFGYKENNLPDYKSAYVVHPVSRISKGKAEYMGMLAVAVAYDGFDYWFQFYDSEGTPIDFRFLRYTSDRYGYCDLWEWDRSVFEIAAEPGGMLILTGRWIAENLQPGVLNVGSILLTDAFEARAAFRAVFIRPNSFAGILARGEEPGLYKRYGFALLTILPSVVLGAVIGWMLRRKALRLGESAGTGRLWLALGILFGIPAWITFAVAGPRATLVTCGNCGSLRRPDRDRCHVCRAGWDLGHLEAPAWRVVEPAGV